MDQFSSVVKDDVSRIERLIHEILGYARYMEPKLGQENINEIVMGCILFLQVKAEQQGIHITHDLGDNLPHMLLDRQQIKQVLLNLFLNAMDAITAPGGRISVRTYVLNKPNQVCGCTLKLLTTGAASRQETSNTFLIPFTQPNTRVRSMRVRGSVWSLFTKLLSSTADTLKLRVKSGGEPRSLSVYPLTRRKLTLPRLKSILSGNEHTKQV